MYSHDAMYALRSQIDFASEDGDMRFQLCPNATGEINVHESIGTAFLEKCTGYTVKT